MTDTETNVQTPETDKYSIVDLAIDSNPTGIETAFDDQIKDIISDKIGEIKSDLAANMFDMGYSSEDEEDSEIDPNDEEEEDDLTDDEIDQLSDEEWDELIDQLENEDEIETNEDPEDA